MSKNKKKKNGKNIVPKYTTLALEDRNKTDKATNAAIPSVSDVIEAREWSEFNKL